MFGCSCMHVCAPVCGASKSWTQRLPLGGAGFLLQPLGKRQVDSSEFKASQEHLMRPISKDNKIISGFTDKEVSLLTISGYSSFLLGSQQLERVGYSLSIPKQRGQWISEYIHSKSERAVDLRVHPFRSRESGGLMDVCSYSAQSSFFIPSRDQPVNGASWIQCGSSHLN